MYRKTLKFSPSPLCLAASEAVFLLLIYHNDETLFLTLVSSPFFLFFIDATSTGDAGVALQNRLQNLNTAHGLDPNLTDLSAYNGLSSASAGSHRYISGGPGSQFQIQNNYQNDDFQQTIRSNKSHGTTEAAVSLANVSDPASGGSSNANKSSSGLHHSQHNYSNIQQPSVPKTTNTSNGGSLTSSRTQSSNASPSNIMLGPESPFGGKMKLPLLYS